MAQTLTTEAFLKAFAPILRTVDGQTDQEFADEAGPLWLQYLQGDARLARLVADITNTVTFENRAIELMASWYAGTADGGPNGDGTYPLRNANGEEFLVPSPARIIADLASLDAQGSVDTEDDLPATGQPGDLWVVRSSGHAWGWSARDNQFNDLGLFQGPQGDAGQIDDITVQTGAAGSEAEVVVGGTPEARTLELTIPRGDPGADAAIEDVTVETGDPGTDASVVVGGTPQARTFAFTLPRGDVGQNATIQDITVQTGAAGSNASVVVGGTPAARTLALTIPRGDTGVTPNVSVAIQLVANDQPATVTRSGTDANPLLTFSLPTPLDGTDGREVEFNVSATHIQVRYVGEATWTNLIALASLKGVKGDKGDPLEFDAKPADLAARAAYDAEPEGFTVLVMDTGTVYARIGATAGAWSDGFPFGQAQNNILVALSELDAAPGVLVQTGEATFEKRDIGAGSDSAILDRQSADAHYRRSNQAIPLADVAGLAAALGEKADAAAVLAALGDKANAAAVATALDAKANLGQNATFGDVKAFRDNGSGVVFLGDMVHYVFFDGVTYSMPGAPLIVDGGTVWTSTTFDPTNFTGSTISGGSEGITIAGSGGLLVGGSGGLRTTSLKASAPSLIENVGSPSGGSWAPSILLTLSNYQPTLEFKDRSTSARSGCITYDDGTFTLRYDADGSGQYATTSFTFSLAQPTAPAGNNSLRVATTAFVQQELSAAKASASAVRAATNNTTFITPKALADADAFVAVTGSGTVTLDGATGRNFQINMTGAVTFAVPSNMKDGQSGTIVFVQDGTGNRTIALSASVRKVGTYTLSTAANSIDRCGYVYRNGVLELTALEKGIA